MKKIFLIYGHYNNKSFNAAIRDTFVKSSEDKGNVIINVGGLEAKKIEIEEKDQKELTYDDGVIIEEADIDKTIVSIGNG